MNIDRLNNATSIKGMIQQLAPEQIRMMLGEVISDDPLKVQVKNDEKLIIPKNLLVIPEWLTCHKYKAYIQTDAYMPCAEPSNDEAHDKQIDTAAFVCNVACPSGAHPCAAHQYKASWIIIKNHLRAGDIVILLGFAGGKKYIVLDRIGKEVEEV